MLPSKHIPLPIQSAEDRERDRNLGEATNRVLDEIQHKIAHCNICGRQVVVEPEAEKQIVPSGGPVH